MFHLLFKKKKTTKGFSLFLVKGIIFTLIGENLRLLWEPERKWRKSMVGTDEDPREPQEQRWLETT